MLTLKSTLTKTFLPLKIESSISEITCSIIL
jgi:hypothetical protein